MKPSWQAQLANAFIKTFVRRRRWGDEQAVSRRARRLFGSLKIQQWLKTRGLRVEQIENEKVCGEWLTPKNPKKQIVLYFHGGGYVSCSAATHRPITAGLARFSRMRVFSLDYRLAPENRFPAALDDTIAAYRWLLDEGFASKQIALAGDSAGGGLVLSALLRMREQGLPFPACAVCFSAWTDLAGTGNSVQSNDNRCAMFRPATIKEFAAAYLGDASPFDVYASPVFGEFDRVPPVLLQIGSTELLLDDARRVHEKIQKAGGASELEIYEDVPHGWQMFDGFVPEARVALKRAATFVQKHLSAND
jgi:acetyl esterase/lipase